jgi:hypothetical protein
VKGGSVRGTSDNGFWTEVRNETDGEKYLISTARAGFEDAELGIEGWQTAVFAIDDSGHANVREPLGFKSSLTFEEAKKEHLRWEDVVSKLPRAEWEKSR